MTAYYNENDPKAAAWLRELIFWGLIADGEVDTRSIEDVTPNDLNGFTQCHFFAGIGGWSYALRLAGWPDDRPVWTGSCPCQPFSAAGKSGGFADERHLWPAFFHLIVQCQPAVVFGEQVASPHGLAWLDLVQTDLEGEGYATGAADLCAAGVGAPHIRQRLYWMADAGSSRQQQHAKRHCEQTEPEQQTSQRTDVDGCRDTMRLGHTSSGRSGRDGRAFSGEKGSVGREMRSQPDISEPASQPSGLAESEGEQSHRSGDARSGRGQPANASDVGDADNTRPQGRGERWNGADKWLTWAASLVDCRDGKRRPVEPGTFPLAHGVPARVGLLRGYGNAIVPQVAAEFIGAYLDAI